MPNTIRNRFVITLEEVLPHWRLEAPTLVIKTNSEKERSQRAYQLLQESLKDQIELCTIGVVLNAEDTLGQMPVFAFNEIPLLGPSSSAPRQICDLVARRIESLSARSVILDITNLPTHISLALCKRLAWSSGLTSELSEVVAVYTKPLVYEANLGGGFTQPSIVTGFSVGDTQGADERQVGWIPVLGFSAKPVLDALDIVLEQALEISPNVDRDDLLNNRTYPIIGWPPYRPDFFNRAISENRRLLCKIRSPERRLLYGSADDPFEVAQLISQLVAERGDVQFICSAQGSQPMNLGCALACSEAGLQMLHSFATSQIPNQKRSYSPGETVAYWLYTRD